MLYKLLSLKEEKQFRQWARDNFKTSTTIDPLWHPIVRDECKKIDRFNRIINSKFALEWLTANRNVETIKEETDFYGRELSPQEWKSNLLDDFFAQDLNDIVMVLPELWSEIKESVKDSLEIVIDSPKDFEEYIGSRFGNDFVEVPFSLSKWLENINNELLKLLE